MLLMVSACCVVQRPNDPQVCECVCFVAFSWQRPSYPTCCSWFQRVVFSVGTTTHKCVHGFCVAFCWQRPDMLLMVSAWCGFPSAQGPRSLLKFSAWRCVGNDPTTRHAVNGFCVVCFHPTHYFCHLDTSNCSCGAAAVAVTVRLWLGQSPSRCSTVVRVGKGDT